jgi:hypothetical protein
VPCQAVKEALGKNFARCWSVDMAWLEIICIQAPAEPLLDAAYA